MNTSLIWSFSCKTVTHEKTIFENVSRIRYMVYHWSYWNDYGETCVVIVGLMIMRCETTQEEMLELFPDMEFRVFEAISSLNTYYKPRSRYYGPYTLDNHVPPGHVAYHGSLLHEPTS